MKAMFCGRMPRLHFVGIGGIGMSGIAEVLLHHGYEVSGSDAVKSEATERLMHLGARVHIGHSAAHVDNAEIVVISTAIKPDNPELIRARSMNLPIVHRGEMLAEIMRLGYGIAVAGSHGKTTTTSLIAHLLAKAGFDPTAVVGGVVKNFGSNAKKGMGDYLVAEADESDGSFLELMPTVAIVTNIDPEHLEHYPAGYPELLKAFTSFVNSIPFYGLGIVCSDHDVIRALYSSFKKRYVTYGLGEAYYTLKDLSIDTHATTFRPVRGRETLSRVKFKMIGRHHAQNALAVLAVADELNIHFNDYAEALSTFEGVGRRFEQKAHIGDILVYEDYGHHPIEISATIAGAKQAFKDRRLLVVFQPHRYSRTHQLLREFGHAFKEADEIIMTDIYPAGESPILGLSGQSIVDQIEKNYTTPIYYCEHKQDIAEQLKLRAKPRDLIIVLGAGDITKYVPVMTEQLKQHFNT